MSKWYVDCVDADGRSAIAYWSSAAWKGLRFSITNLAAQEPGSKPRYWGRFSHSTEPVCAGGAFAWKDDELGFSINGQAQRPRFGMRLLEDRRGTADWECRACPARLAVALPGGAAFSGLGYVERLTFGFAPWTLPIDELRWGRWIAADGERSLVWIDWRGTHPLTAVFLDGVRDPSAVVGDDRVTVADAALSLTARRTLHRRALRDVVDSAGPMSRVLPETWLDVQDCKWLSHGRLDAPGARPETGWVIHERVRFP